MSAAADLVTAAIEQARDQLAAVRQQLAERKDRRNQIERVPLPLELAAQNVDGFIADRAELYAEGINVNSFAEHDVLHATNLAPNYSSTVDVTTRMLCFYQPDKVRELLTSKLSAALADREALSPADKAAALDEIDVQIAELERAEERAIRAGESAGIHLVRRADADPRAVLAKEL